MDATMNVTDTLYIEVYKNQVGGRAIFWKFR